MEIKVIFEEFAPKIIEFEKKQLTEKGLSDKEIEMKSWESSWREEALDHYAELGWSFIAVENKQVVGCILAQPILFFNGWTQTLWIDHLSCTNEAVAKELLDTSVKWAKTKHLQKVLVNSKAVDISLVKNYSSEFQQGEFLHISTTKLSEG